MVNYEKLTNNGLNIDTLMKRLMGNASLIKVFIMKFTSDLTFESLAEAFDAGDAKKAEIASHTLKGMCGNMSLDSLYDLFTEQVNLIRAGEINKAEAMMDKITPQYSRAVEAMKEWISEN